MDKNVFYAVGDLAKKMDVSVRTLQYYDKEGLLIPSGRTEGGRRLYSQKDMVKLHQILSMKYLGFSLEEIKNDLFSLDTAHDVYALLGRQKIAVQNQIADLNKALNAIDVLRQEIVDMKEVSFEKYADIIAFLRVKDYGYWWSSGMFQHDSSKPIKEKIMKNVADDPNFSLRLYKEFSIITDKMHLLVMQGESPTGEKGQQVAAELWAMIMEFSGGDINMIPKLMKFNEHKEGWPEDIKAKQLAIDTFMGEALGFYLKKQSIYLPETEVQE